METSPKPSKRYTNILDKLKKLRNTIDFEIVICKKEIRLREIRMSEVSGQSSTRGKRRLITAKVEKEKYENAIQDLLSLQKELSDDILQVVTRHSNEYCNIISKYLTTKVTMQELADEMQMPKDKVIEVINNFENEIIKYLRNIDLSNYFDL